jgi:hypothetical protein
LWIIKIIFFTVLHIGRPASTPPLPRLFKAVLLFFSLKAITPELLSLLRSNVTQTVAKPNKDSSFQKYLVYSSFFSGEFDYYDPSTYYTKTVSSSSFMVLLYITQESTGIYFVSALLLSQKKEFLLVSLFISFMLALCYHFVLNFTASCITDPLKTLALITARFLKS